jgi:hypothetical protein
MDKDNRPSDSNNKFRPEVQDAKKHNFSETGCFSVFRWGAGETCFVGSVGPKWRRKKIQFPKRCVRLEYRTMDKVQKPSNPMCYTPSSEPFKIYLKNS